MTIEIDHFLNLFFLGTTNLPNFSWWGALVSIVLLQYTNFYSERKIQHEFQMVQIFESLIWGGRLEWLWHLLWCAVFCFVCWIWHFPGTKISDEYRLLICQILFADFDFYPVQIFPRAKNICWILFLASPNIWGREWLWHLLWWRLVRGDIWTSALCNNKKWINLLLWKYCTICSP